MNMGRLLGHMKCEDALEKLHHFLDDELHATEIADMVLHLDGCDGCTHEAEVISRLKSIVREACAEVAPAHLRERIAELNVSISADPA
jgi:mycothiol system anti-sigma-R factor